jgi:two-component system response regulator LytT
MHSPKILVVENETIISDHIISILQELEYSPIQPVTNYTEALEQIEHENPDLVLIDIFLEGRKTGIDLAEEINLKHKLPFIFLTANADRETVDLAKKTKPQAYLVKPFDKEDLYTAIELSLHKFAQQAEANNPEEETEEEKYIFIKDNRDYIKVLYSDITYATSDHVYFDVYTVQRKKYVVRGSLAEYEKRLGPNFFRVHRSHLINLNYLESVNHKEVTVNGVTIPLGQSHRQDLLNKINRA